MTRQRQFSEQDWVVVKRPHEVGVIAHAMGEPKRRNNGDVVYTMACLPSKTDFTYLLPLALVAGRVTPCKRCFPDYISDEDAFARAIEEEDAEGWTDDEL